MAKLPLSRASKDGSNQTWIFFVFPVRNPYVLDGLVLGGEEEFDTMGDGPFYTMTYGKT
jgi:hypothetical protein